MLTKRSVLGLFTDENVVADAMDALKEAGYAPDTEYEVLTGTPYPEGTFGDEASYAIPKVRSNPEGLRAFDADGDGRQDIAILSSFGDLRLYVQTDDGFDSDRAGA